MNQEEYESAISELEKSYLPDKRGRFDLYVCSKCGEFIVTTCLDKGYTLDIIQCPHCSFGTMEYKRSFENADSSVKYQVWRRPTFEEFAEMSDRMKEQVLNGMLILYLEKENKN